MTRFTLTIGSAALLSIAVLAGYLTPHATQAATITGVEGGSHICGVNDEHFNTQDGGCTDLQTELVWGNANLGMGSNWQYDTALQHVEDSTEGGFTDWRLPTREELETLVANDGHAHFAEGFPGSFFWSSTGGGAKRWVVDVTSGEARRFWAGGATNDHANFVGVREASVGGGGGGPAVVDCITYDTSGGPNGDKHLKVIVIVVDDQGNPIGDADVSITVNLGGNLYESTTGTTDGSGEVSFSFGNAPAGLFSTDVTAVETGFTFDGTEPANSFDKGTDAAPVSFGSCGDG